MKPLQVTLSLVVSLLVYCGCTKPRHIHTGGGSLEWTAVTGNVWLKDTISPSYIRPLQLEQVQGIAFHYADGTQTSYFTYNADPAMALNALSRLAAPLRDFAVDISYHWVSPDEWTLLKRTVGPHELFEASSFWNADLSQVDIYASAKNEHHLLLIEKGGRNIMHRITGRG